MAYLNSFRASTILLYAKLRWLASADLRLIFMALKTIIKQKVTQSYRSTENGKPSHVFDFIFCSTGHVNNFFK